MRIVFLYILAVSNLISFLHIGMYTIGANSFDIMQSKRNHHSRLRAQKRKKALHQPLLSVVIPAHNEAKGIRATLDSVLANSYPNIEVIVVDDGSTDKTYALVQEYIKKVKKKVRLRIRSYFSKTGYYTASKHYYVQTDRRHCTLKVISQRNQGKATAMNNAIQHHVKGQFVMCLDADSILHPLAIEQAVAYFKDHNVIGVAANVRIMNSRSLLGKLQQFEHMIGYRSKKFYSVANCEFIIGGVASTYRKSVLKKVKFYDNDTLTEDIGLSLKIVATEGNRKRRIIYAPNVVAFTEGVHSYTDLLKQRYRWKMGNLQNLFKYKALIGQYNPGMYSRMLTLYRLPMALISEVMLIIEPVLLGYVIYLSLMYHTVAILFGAYLTVTGYTLLVVWPDEHLQTKDKIRMSISALWMYSLFYIMDTVQIYAVFKSLRFYDKILHHERTLATWVSPRRVLRAQNS